MDTTTKPSTKGRMLRIIAAIAIGATVAMGALFGVGQSADAATYGGYSGRPGAVGALKVVAHPSQERASIYGNNLPAQIRMPGLTVYRSAASTGTQHVSVAHRVFQWNGARWVLWTTTNWNSATIPAGSSWVNVNPDVYVQPGSGYYYVESLVWWYVGGVAVGSQTFMHNAASDYTCMPYQSGMRVRGICSPMSNGYVLIS